MASSVGAGRTRAVLWGLAGLVLLVFLIDAGSCTIARIQVEDDAKASGRFAAQSITGQQVNQQTAVVAYNAAQTALPNNKETIIQNGPGDRQDFRVDADGSVTLTVQRPAPTLVFRFLPKLKSYTVATSTFTQPKLGF